MYFLTDVYIHMQRTVDEKHALVTWEYEEYQFAILADRLSEESDIGPVGKPRFRLLAICKRSW